MEIIIGIYKIKNKINNKIYIGSSKDIYKRKTQHISELRGGYHTNIFLQKSWIKYGEDNFIFSILEVVPDIKNLLEREQFYIDKHYDYGEMCYNLNPIAKSPPESSVPCALYSKDGKFIKKFESLLKCSVFINSSVSRGIDIDNMSLIDGKYMVCRLFDGWTCEDVGRYIPKNHTSIYILKDDGSVENNFSNIRDVCIHINGVKDIIEENKINNCLSKMYRYKNRVIIYESDYKKRGNFVRKVGTFKYILKFSISGELLDVLDNKYGLKISSKIQDNCKKNNRIIELGRLNSAMSVNSHDNCVYIRSNEVIRYIKTNVSVYILEDTENNSQEIYIKQNQLCLRINEKKSFVEYYIKKDKLFKNRYKLKKVIY